MDLKKWIYKTTTKIGLATTLAETQGIHPHYNQSMRRHRLQSLHNDMNDDHDDMLNKRPQILY